MSFGSHARCYAIRPVCHPERKSRDPVAQA
jgi:hypothetical protein